MTEQYLENIKLDIETFGYESLKLHLKSITSSKNYQVIKSGNNMQILFFTKKYLTPYAKSNKLDYNMLENFSMYNNFEFKETLNSLIACKKVKHLKEKNMPLHTFIQEVINWCSMCGSLLAYHSSGQEYFNSRDTYDLPKEVKQEIYDYMKTQVADVKCGVHTDSEGCTYNSITYK